MPLEDQVQAEWRAVLSAKKAAGEAAGPGQVEARQAYASALAAFLRNHPDHGRGRAVYEEMELEYARLLASRGRYDEAVRYYASILESNPGNEVARAEMDEAERKRFVTPEELEVLRRGMSPEEVEQRLGRPLPGWSRRMVRGTTVTESWYYRRRDGGVAGVFFRNGELFAAEFEQPVRLDS